MSKLLLGLRDWVDARLPIMRAWNTHMGQYYAPKNFNFWYFFGVLSLLVLVNQLLTGIWLTMMFVPSAADAFASVEYIMRDVDYGWIIRYMHSTGASAFFIVIYLHMFRALLYGSYRKPRELVWVFGMLIFFALMAEAFLGYILPWGQMSYWGAQVIVSLFGAIPVVGDALIEWIRGDYLISGVTLNRFFALHVVAVPIIILALVVLHLLALHEVGSNNPDGVEIKKHKDKNGVPLDGVAFHPYYTVHDIVGIVVFLMVFCGIIFFFPEMGGYFLEYANFEQADSLKTPAHIAPVWYFTPFYSVLRAVPDKLLGFMAFGGSVAILFVLPWLDRSPVKSIRYKGKLNIVMLFIFSSAFLILGVLGVKSPTVPRTQLAQLCSVIYFAYFILMPFFSATDRKVSSSFVAWFFSILTGLAFLFLAVHYMNDQAASLAISIVSAVFAIGCFALPKLVERDTFQKEPERITMNGGFGMKGTLLGVLIVALLTIIPLKAVGSEAGFDCGAIACEKFEPNLQDKAALQDGAKTFINYCLGCHAMQYMRYERLATDLGIPLELAEEHFIFDDAKIGDLMLSPVPAPVIKKWFGAAPPDLTLAARARGDAWLYTYLKSFYKDEKRPYGYNNLVFKDVGMPNVLANVQGEQLCKPAFAVAANGGMKRDPLSYENIEDEHHACGRAVHIKGTGTLSTQEFDVMVANLVSFMVYAAEPTRLHDRTFLGIDLNQREVIGVYCLLFLAVFLVLAILLNREYWKDIH
jgi:ubiquinol-cytochrome c reductase cytochrome b subunit